MNTLRIQPYLGLLALIILAVSLAAEDKLNEKRILLPYNSGVPTNFTVHTRGDGEVQISYNDVHNSLMFNSQMNIYIRPIEAIEILPSIVEASIGGTVVLPVAVLGFLNGIDGEKAYFDDCVQVSFDVDIVESSRVRYQSNNVMPGIGMHSCRSFSFECTAVGNSRIWISYGQNKEIKTSAIVGCYGPIVVMQPTESPVLSLGSSIDIAFEGGPRPWSMYPEGHYTKVTAVNSSLISIAEIKDRYRYNKELHVYRTKCLDYGEAEVTLEAGNIKSPTLMNPASTSTTVKINCSKPKTLIIQHKLSKSTCPQHDFVFKLEKNRKIELDVLVLDDQGNSFYNFTSLYFDWSMDGNGEFQKTNGINEEVIGAKGYSTITRSFQVISQLTTARSKVRGRITGYHESFWGDSFDVFREVEIILTDPIATEEDNLSLLKHSSYKKSIKIQKGSGHFSVDYTSKDIINVQMKPNSRTIDIVPLNVGSGVITITDLCLSYPKHTIAFSVVEALDVNLDLIDKIELGSTVKGTFYVLDHRGMKMHSSLHSVLNVVTSNSFLEISDIKPINDYITSFSVKATSIGISKVLIRSQSDDLKSVQSGAIEVQVFSPLQIVPSNITLIVGNHFQANFIGGPQTQRNIEFVIGDPLLASVANNGLIKALKIGKTKLTARATNINNFEYSRAEVEVHVVPLKKIKIWSPVNQIVLGSHMPLYLIGSSEQHETPFMCGQAEPALNVTWTLSNEKIASIESSFQKFGIVDSVTDQIAARFSAKTVGTVTVKARVEVTVPPNSRDTEQIWKSIILTDSVQINVLTTFAPYLSPSFAAAGATQEIANTKVLLLSPNAELMLHFNHLDEISYKVLNSTSVRIINDTELVLQAGDQQELALLLLTRDVHKTGLIEFYSFVVHVERVRYLSLEFLDTTFIQERSSTSSIDVFPLGSESHLVVNFFDNHGRKFDSVKSNLKWHLSRNDIITVLSDPLDNTLKIRALKEGSVVMQVTDQVNQVGAFYKINVGALDGGSDIGAANGEQTVVSAPREAVVKFEESGRCSPSSNNNINNLQSPPPPYSSTTDSFYYATTLIFGTLLLAVVLYFLIRYLASIPFGGKVKEYGAAYPPAVGNAGDLSFTNGSPSSSPRRVVDYQNTSSGNLNTTLLATPSINRTRLSTLSLHQSPTSPSVNTPSTPISPRSRSLYSLRQSFQ